MRFKAWRGIRRLERDHRVLMKEAKEWAAKAREKKDDRIYEEWRAENDWRFELDEWGTKGIITRELLREAERLGLPTPSTADTDKWEEDVPYGLDPALTLQAQHELRLAIRREKLERREVIEWWVKVIGGLIGALTGLVGASIGLVSVFRHLK